MKKLVAKIFVLCMASCAVGNAAFAGNGPGSIPKSEAFNKMKELVGTWKGTGSDMGDGTVEVQYRLTSGGTAVLETLFPGTPHEMNSVYYEEGGKLVMTHYCMLGNHPVMTLQKMDPSALQFNFAKSNPQKLSSEAHMHSLQISFTGPDTIVEKWAMYDHGKEQHDAVFKLQRAS